MIGQLRDRRARAIASFAAINIGVIVFLVVFVVSPLLSHFSDRADDIAEDVAQIAHFKEALRQSKAVTSGLANQDGVFLHGVDESIASADLQSGLKSMAVAAGVNLLSMRGSPSIKIDQLRMVVVSLELEGTMISIRDLMRSIETQTPLLFINSLSVRSATEGDDASIKATMTVQGAVRETREAGVQ